MKSSRIIAFLLIAIFTLSLIPSAQAAKNIVIVHDEVDDKVGQFTSLAVVNGYPAISYVDYTNRNLQYVRATDASGSDWGTPILIDIANVIGPTNLLVVDGKPAIAYADRVLRIIKYVRAEDADGTTWDTPVEVDNSGTSGDHVSMAIVNGKPAIAYHDNTNENLMYVQAADAQGNNWNDPVIVDDTEDAGDRPSLAVVDDRPTIAYYEFTNDDANYVRALDADGATWGTPVTIDDDGGDFYSLVVVDGKPAIAYSDWVIDALKYIRATDSKGTSWNTPQVLDSQGRSIGLFTSLSILNGFPAIAYVQNGSGHPDLRFIVAKNAAGSDWNPHIVVDSDAGWYLSLVEVDGAASISYYDNAISALKYVHLQLEQTIYLPLVIK